MDYKDLVKGLEEIVKTPSYVIIGNLKGIPILFTMTEGERTLSALKGDRLEELSKGNIVGTVVTKPDQDFIPLVKDVEKGKEIHAIHAVKLSGEEFEISNPRMRITSIAYDGKDKIVYTASSPQSTSLYIIEGGKERKIADVNPFLAVDDVSGDYIIGEEFKGGMKASDLVIITLSGEFKYVTPKEGSLNGYARIYGDKVYFVSDYEFSGERSWVYTYSLKDGNFERVTFEHKDLEVYEPVEVFYNPYTQLALATKDGETRLFLNGKMLKTPPGSVTGATRVDDVIYFSHSSLVSSPKVYKLKGESVEVVVSNRDPISGKVDYVKVKNGDVEVPTFIVTPNNAKRVGVIYVHGGPWYAVYNMWDTIISSLLFLGYVVMAPNFRGSTGYGNKFMLMDIGDPGGGDLSDVVRVRDYVIEKGVVDKVGIMGYSYGGYMTLLAVGKEANKWDFGVAGAPVADWVEMYELSDDFFKSFIDILFNGHNVELMKDRSPITYVDRVKAPLCIIQAQNDTRTPAIPVLKYCLKLQELGKRFELHLIPDMGHVVYTMDDVMKLVFPAVLFLERIFPS